MKRANPLSRAARLAKTKREQEEARREREKQFPKPKLVSEIDQSHRDEHDEPENPRQARASVTDRPNAGGQQARQPRWRIPGFLPTSSWENVIFAFVPAR